MGKTIKCIDKHDWNDNEQTVNYPTDMKPWRSIFYLTVEGYSFNHASWVPCKNVSNCPNILRWSPYLKRGIWWFNIPNLIPTLEGAASISCGQYLDQTLGKFPQIYDCALPIANCMYVSHCISAIGLARDTPSHHFGRAFGPWWTSDS